MISSRRIPPTVDHAGMRARQTTEGEIQRGLMPPVCDIWQVARMNSAPRISVDGVQTRSNSRLSNGRKCSARRDIGVRFAGPIPRVARDGMSITIISAVLGISADVGSAIGQSFAPDVMSALACSRMIPGSSEKLLFMSNAGERG